MLRKLDIFNHYKIPVLTSMQFLAVFISTLFDVSMITVICALALDEQVSHKSSWEALW